MQNWQWERETTERLVCEWLVGNGGGTRMAPKLEEMAASEGMRGGRMVDFVRPSAPDSLENDTDFFFSRNHYTGTLYMILSLFVLGSEWTSLIEKNPRELSSECLLDMSGLVARRKAIYEIKMPRVSTDKINYIEGHGLILEKNRLRG